MKRVVSTVLLTAALVLSLQDVWAMPWGDSRHRGSSADASETYAGRTVPEPFALYAVASGIAFLAGAGWYIRRRK